jgi:transposase
MGSRIHSGPFLPLFSDTCIKQEVFALPWKNASRYNVKIFLLTSLFSPERSACPGCARSSSRVHGRYTRTLADLSCQEKVARLRLEVRRFVCLTRTCPRTTFAERFPTLTRTYARRTLRQADVLKKVAFADGEAKRAHGGRNASRCQPVAIPSSG